MRVGNFFLKKDDKLFKVNGFKACPMSGPDLICVYLKMYYFLK